MKKIAIIGDSISSLGALYFLLENIKKDFKLFHIVDNRKIEINYEKLSEFNRYLGEFGTSNYWHAVSPFENSESNSYKKLFEILYGFVPKVSSPCLFTPYIRPNSAKAINSFRNQFHKFDKNKYNLINNTVNKIEIDEKKNQKRIFLDSGEILNIDVCILTVNPLDILEILKIETKNLKLYDHIHTCHGVINTKGNSTTLNQKSFQNIYGYMYNYEKFKKSIIYLKPFYGKPAKVGSQLNFGKKKSEIYKDILLSRDLSPKFNAVSSKFGIRFPTKYHSLWSQQVVERKYKRNENLKLYVPTADFNKIQLVRHPDMEKINYKSDFIIPGNHLYMIMKEDDYKFYDSLNIFFSTIKPNLDYFDGRHSSLLLSDFLYQDLKNKLESRL